LKGTQTKSPLHGRRDASRHVHDPQFDAEASAELRDRLIAEIDGLASSDRAATWAHEKLSEKNKLIDADARVLEHAFQARLDAIEASGILPSAAIEQNPAPATPRVPDESAPKSSNRRRARAIDKSILAMPEPRRLRDRDHIRAVAQRPCLICGRRPADAHHLRFAQSKALGRKVSDEFTVPYAAVTIAKSTGAATKPRGGEPPASIRPRPLARFGSKATRCR
jgi:hypothetical protein